MKTVQISFSEGLVFELIYFLIVDKQKVNSSLDVKKESFDGGSGYIAAHTFTFRELATATKNFRADCLLGEGGFGRVYRGRLESTNQVCSSAIEKFECDYGCRFYYFFSKQIFSLAIEIVNSFSANAWSV